MTLPALVTGDPPPSRVNPLTFTTVVPVVVCVNAGWTTVCPIAVAGTIRFPWLMKAVAVPSLVIGPLVRIVKLPPGSLTNSASFSRAKPLLLPTAPTKVATPALSSLTPLRVSVPRKKPVDR